MNSKSAFDELEGPGGPSGVPTQKHLFWNKAHDWFVATDYSDAKDLAIAYYRYEGVPPHNDLFAFVKEPDDAVLTFVQEDGTTMGRPAGEWAAEANRGFYAHEDWED